MERLFRPVAPLGCLVTLQGKAVCPPEDEGIHVQLYTMLQMCFEHFISYCRTSHSVRMCMYMCMYVYIYLVLVCWTHATGRVLIGSG